MLLAAVLEFCRSFAAKMCLMARKRRIAGMADAFAGVVMLLVAAGVFAQGLSTIEAAVLV